MTTLGYVAVGIGLGLIVGLVALIYSMMRICAEIDDVVEEARGLRQS